MDIMRKALEEYNGAEEMKKGHEYFWTESNGNVCTSIWFDEKLDNHRQLQDNFLPCKNYTQEQAIEYFNKRDARRAAETKLRKIIADMNKKDGFVAKFNNGQFSYFSSFDSNLNCYIYDSTAYYPSLPIWRYSSKTTTEFINENHADLLDIYLERE